MPDRRETFELAPEPGRTALVVVDMQRGFLDPSEAMEVALSSTAPCGRRT
jgi:nicotinamidase-related amidase